MNPRGTQLVFWVAAGVVGLGLAWYADHLQDGGSRARSRIQQLRSGHELPTTHTGKATVDIQLFSLEDGIVTDAKTKEADQLFWRYETKLMAIARAKQRREDTSQSKREVDLWYKGQLEELSLPNPSRSSDSRYRAWAKRFRKRHSRIPGKCRTYYGTTP